MPSMRTGELASQTGVGVETLRYYEREGLLPEPPRRRSGYRDYPPEAVERLRFIRRAQQLGFSLQEIKELLELRNDEDAACDEVRQRTRAKIASVERKIRDLRAMKKALERLAAACPGDGPADSCPILRLVEFESSHPDHPDPLDHPERHRPPRYPDVPALQDRATVAWAAAQEPLRKETHHGREHDARLS